MKVFKKISIFTLAIITILPLFSCKVYNSKKESGKTKETIYETTVAMAYDSKSGFARTNAELSVEEDIALEDGFYIEGSEVENPRLIHFCTYNKPWLGHYPKGSRRVYYERWESEAREVLDAVGYDPAKEPNEAYRWNYKLGDWKPEILKMGQWGGQ